MQSLRLRYQTIEFGKIDIHLCSLRNRQEFYDPQKKAEKLGISPATWPVFGVVWPSSLVLANYMSTFETGTKRILEVGCGMALTSLLLNKQSADITATDRHPEAQPFLNRNTLLNGDSEVAFERVDWDSNNDDLGLFDVIIGSDLLYEDEHVKLLANFINKHSKKTCEIILVDPGRGRKAKMTTLMESLGFSSNLEKPDTSAYMDDEFKGHILTYER